MPAASFASHALFAVSPAPTFSVCGSRRRGSSRSAASPPFIRTAPPRIGGRVTFSGRTQRLARGCVSVRAPWHHRICGVALRWSLTPIAFFPCVLLGLWSWPRLCANLRGPTGNETILLLFEAALNRFLPFRLRRAASPHRGPQFGRSPLLPSPFPFSRQSPRRCLAALVVPATADRSLLPKPSAVLRSPTRRALVARVAPATPRRSVCRGATDFFPSGAVSPAPTFVGSRRSSLLPAPAPNPAVEWDACRQAGSRPSPLR